MIKVLFICHGNICRSPMAEFIMKHIVDEAGLTDSFLIESAAVSSEEEGNPVYPPARTELLKHGIDPAGKRARKITESDYDRYDYLIGMESWNLKGMRREMSRNASDPEGKFSLLMDFTDRPRDIADPWYSGNFKLTYDEIYEGCTALLSHILETETL